MTADRKTNFSPSKKSRTRGRPGSDTRAGFEATRQIVEQVLRNEFVPEPGKLLELGCGTGGIALWLRDMGWEAHGVDISPEAIGRAAESAWLEEGTADFRVGNAIFLWGWEDEMFDLVLDCSCLHRIIGDDRARFLENAFRVLRPGGCMIAYTPCGPTVSRSARGYDRESRCQIVKGVAVRFFGRPDEISAEFENAGFMLARRELHDATAGRDQDCMLIAALKPLIEGNQFPVSPHAYRTSSPGGSGRGPGRPKKTT
jgi:ubiquinone/menaquinone biosynthesis C-methylase UbiE